MFCSYTLSDALRILFYCLQLGGNLSVILSLKLPTRQRFQAGYLAEIYLLINSALSQGDEEIQSDHGAVDGKRRNVVKRVDRGQLALCKQFTETWGCI